MNIFAGNFSLKEKVQTPDLDLDIVQTSETSYFIMGADESADTSEKVKQLLEKEFWEFESYDISIEGEDELEILSSEYEEGTYECVSFEGPNIDFDGILERFADSMEVICVREAQSSQKYWNRVIKADFLY